MSYRMLRGPLFRLLRLSESWGQYEQAGLPVSPGIVEDKTEELRFRPARGFFWLRLFQWGAGFVFALGAEFLYLVGVDLDQMVPSWIEILAIAGTLVAAVGQYYKTHLEYDVRQYVINDRQVRIRHGAWTVHDATYSIPNIQNLQVKQGPLERLFGISRLVIETAGGGSHDDKEGAKPGHRGILDGLEKPSELRDWLQKRLTRHKSSGLGDRSRVLSTQIDVALVRSIRDELRGISSSLER